MTTRQEARLQSGESAERGRAARQLTPRSVHGQWTPDRDRPDPMAVLTAQAANRVPELVPIRYGRMLISPFTFYRGAAAVMAADLAAPPTRASRCRPAGTPTSPTSEGSRLPDRRLVFGPNDFDETLPGPWEWDVKRMAASVEIAGTRHRAAEPNVRRRLVAACVRQYREGMRGFAAESHLDVWYDRLTASELVDRFGGNLDSQRPDAIRRPFAKARRKTSFRAVQKLTERVARRPALPQFSTSARSPPRPARDDPPTDEADYVQRAARRLCREPRRGSALPVRDLPVRGHGSQGRRRRQRRHPRLASSCS